MFLIPSAPLKYQILPINFDGGLTKPFLNWLVIAVTQNDDVQLCNYYVLGADELDIKIITHRVPYDNYVANIEPTVDNSRHLLVSCADVKITQRAMYPITVN